MLEWRRDYFTCSQCWDSDSPPTSLISQDEERREGRLVRGVDNEVRAINAE